MAEGFPTRAGFGFLGAQDEMVAQPSGSQAALDGELSDGSRSDLIDSLLNRRSILPAGPFSQVADAVLEANSRAAEADLRAAMLRSEAREMNWLPSLGPQVSLTSLGAVVTNLVVDQVIFDNGGKRAEREFARADVEVAAVALAQDTNDRVYQALDLYLTAEAARARAAVHEGAMARMERFEYVMSERVRAGINDRSDLALVQQRLTQMRSDLASDHEERDSALAELEAMSASPVRGISGVSDVQVAGHGEVALNVMKAEAESARAIAEARASRAGYLPGVSASGSFGNGTSGAVTVGAPNGLRIGMGRDVAALEAQEQAAAARVSQEREDSNREVAALEGEIASLRRQLRQSEGIIAQATTNYNLFEEQLKAGQRSVPEVVGVFRTKLEAERDAVAIRFNIQRQELKLAALKGELVDGEKI